VDNGYSLDVVGSYDYYKVCQFIKADQNTKAVTFVPLKIKRPDPFRYATKDITKDIGTYPMEFKMDENGKVIVTDVRIKESTVEIDFYIEGHVIIDGFYIADDDANLSYANRSYDNRYFGAMIWNDAKINYENNSYTRTLIFYNDPDDGKVWMEKPSQNVIDRIQNINKLGLSLVYCEPDFANGVRIELQ
jgi:hypothetical protein